MNILNNTISYVKNFYLSNLINNQLNTTTNNSNYIKTIEHWTAKDYNFTLYDRLINKFNIIQSYFIVNNNIEITDLPNELLDYIFANLSINDLSNTSKTCKIFYLRSKYYRDKLLLANKLFLEKNKIEQVSIKYLFNKDNYENIIRPWFIKCCNDKSRLNHLDSIKDSKYFHEYLFFYITKTMNQHTRLNAVNKFIVHGKITTVSSSNNGAVLFIAYLNGAIEIYSLNKNSEWFKKAEFNLNAEVESAKFSPNDRDIAVITTEHILTILKLNKKNNWQINPSDHVLGYREISTYASFSSNSKCMLSINGTTFRYGELGRNNYWNLFSTILCSSTINVANFSENNKYCAIGQSYANFIICTLENIMFDGVYEATCDSNIIDISFSNNNYCLVSTSQFSQIYIFQHIEKNRWNKFTFIDNNNLSVAYFIEDDKKLALINNKGDLRILNSSDITNYIQEYYSNIDYNQAEVSISPNKNYIALYEQGKSIVQIYTLNNKSQLTYGCIEINNESPVNSIKFSNNEHYLLLRSTTTIKIYNLEAYKIKQASDKTPDYIESQLKPFVITTSENLDKHIMFNPFFNQLLIAEGNILKVFIPRGSYNWSDELTIKIENPIKSVNYINNGSHILLISDDNIQHKVNLLEVIYK